METSHHDGHGAGASAHAPLAPHCTPITPTRWTRSQSTKISPCFRRPGSHHRIFAKLAAPCPKGVSSKTPVTFVRLAVQHPPTRHATHVHFRGASEPSAGGPQNVHTRNKPLYVVSWVLLQQNDKLRCACCGMPVATSLGHLALSLHRSRLTTPALLRIRRFS